LKGEVLISKYKSIFDNQTIRSVNIFKKFRVTDAELVKQNLYNHFNVRKGEKLMQPNFGTIIWNMLFEPLTEETKAILNL
jgi:phage baseplate assembly protein W